MKCKLDYNEQLVLTRDEYLANPERAIAAARDGRAVTIAASQKLSERTEAELIVELEAARDESRYLSIRLDDCDDQILELERLLDELRARSGT